MNVYYSSSSSGRERHAVAWTPSAGIGTFSRFAAKLAGCRGFLGPVPPPLWMSGRAKLTRSAQLISRSLP